MKNTSQRNYTYCKNCNQSLTPESKYCHNCSQKYTDDRITFFAMLREFSDAVFNLDSLIFKTIGALFIPGKLTEEYFIGKHKSYVHPLRVFLVMTIAFIAAANYTINDPDFMGLQEDLYKDKTNQERYQYLIELDSIKGEIANEFDNDSVHLALDKLVSKIAHGRKVEEKDSTYLIDLKKTLHFSTDRRIATEDLFNLSSEELLDKYEIEGKYRRFFTAQHIRLRLQGSTFGSFLLSNITWMIFLMMPFLALLLKLLHIRRGYYYVEHLIFSFHTHSFTFLVCIGMVLFGHLAEVWVVSGGFAIIAIYLYQAMRRIYGQNTLKTVIKYSISGLFYWMILILFIFLTFIASFALF